MKRIAITCALALSVTMMHIANAETKPKYEVGKWSFQVVQDKMNDKNRGIALLRNSGGVVAGLIFKCDSQVPRRVYAEVRVSDYVGDSSESGQYRDIDYRVDSNQPQTLQAVYGDKFAMIPSGGGLKKFASEIATGKHLVVRMRNYKFESIETEFELGNAADSIRRVAATCKVESPI